MKNVLVKNVSEDAWVSLKTEAILHKMNIGEFISYLVLEHKKVHRKSNWDRILNYRSKRTIAEMDAHAEEVRKNRANFKLER